MQLTTKLIGGKGQHSIMSRDGFYAMTQIAEEEGVFEASESTVIKNLLTFKSIQAKDVMTPRTVMKTVDENMTVEEFFKEFVLISPIISKSFFKLIFFFNFLIFFLFNFFFCD